MDKEEYYKFTYEIMPKNIFNSGPLMVYKLLRNEEKFLEDLNTIWSSIDVESKKIKNYPPNFYMNIVQLNIEHTAIIISITDEMIPKEDEHPGIIGAYLAIIYDNDDNFRYFTYELNNDTEYILREVYIDRDPTNYGSYIDNDREFFEDKLSEIVLYDLL